MRNFFVPEHLSGGIKGCPTCKQEFHFNSVNVIFSDSEKGRFLIHAECLSCGSKQLSVYQFMVQKGFDESKQFPIESAETITTDLTKDEVIEILGKGMIVTDDDAIAFHQDLETSKHDKYFSKS